MFEKFTSKFRVVDKENGKIIKPNLSKDYFVRSDGKVFRVENRKDGVNIIEVRQFEVNWFIGVTDKNSKEVYEGDIIERESPKVDGEVALPKYEGARGIVEYNKGRFTVSKFSGHKWAFYGPEGINFSWDLDVKVIGNVYENKSIIDFENETE